MSVSAPVLWKSAGRDGETMHFYRTLSAERLVGSLFFCRKEEGVMDFKKSRELKVYEQNGY